MTELSIVRKSSGLPAKRQIARRLERAATIGLVVAILLCVWFLETRFRGLEIRNILIEDTPVTLYQAAGETPSHLVVMAHGFAGSRQMMDQLAVSVARQGNLVASMDLPGHGRNTVKLSPNITHIEGTTAQLVAVVQAVVASLANDTELEGTVSYLGHSMATDVVIRASQARSDVGAVVAISMYSPAVTETSPQALLVISGAREAHLRQAGLEAVRQLDPSARENETVSQGETRRRASVTPLVGHVGVLYAAASLSQVTDWVGNVTGAGRTAAPDQTGWVAGLALTLLVLLAWPLSKWLPTSTQPISSKAPMNTFLLCLICPLGAILAVAFLPAMAIFGYAAFGSLACMLLIWGVVQLLFLHLAGIRLGRPDLIGFVAFLVFGIGIFALALDRYGAAFVPGGDRVKIMMGLLVGTIPLMVADSLMVQGAGLWRRFLARLALLAGLAGAMALSPTELGLTFTTLPVLLLFFVVYGTIARWIEARRGSGGVAFAKGVTLAWALAASTPLFAVAAPL